MNILAENQGTEKGGRGLLAKACKLHEGLEAISHTMDKQVSAGQGGGGVIA